MKRRVREETILFISVVKWVILATLVGIIVGSSTALFLKGLEFVVRQSTRQQYYYLLLPVGFILSAYIIKKFAPEAEGHGTEKVIEAVHKKSGFINVAVVPIKLLTTYITIGTGGSVGKEGPCAQIGAGLASLFAELARFSPEDRKRLVICGISAGFAAVFGTPIAGAIFGVEVLVVGSILYEVLLPSIVAGITAFYVSTLFGITYFYHHVNLSPVFHEKFFLEVAASGLFFGLCSVLLIELIKMGKKFYDSLKWHYLLRNAFGGVILAVITFITTNRYLGLGLIPIQEALSGKSVSSYDFVMKSIFTSVTLNFGGSGGIVTPIFFVGSTAGSFIGSVFGLDRATFAAIGMVSVLAGAANTPIAACIMAMELFGTEIAPYAAVACIVSFLMTGHRSVYPSQILSIKKSPSIKVEMGKEMDEISAVASPRQKGFVSTVMKIVKILKKS